MVDRLLLLFPHQLFADNHRLARGKRVCLIEDELLFDQFPFHQQKLVLHRATMRAHADTLRADGHHVTYLAGRDARPLDRAIAGLVGGNRAEIHLIDPVDDWLEQRTRRAAEALRANLIIHDTPMFLCSRAEVHELLGARQRLFMAPFYAAQRRRLDVLMENGAPVGGQWSFDQANRRRLPRGLTPPPLVPPRDNEFVIEAREYVRSRYGDNPGSAVDFAYPVTYAAAREWLDTFLEQRLAQFGPYEDALPVEHRSIFHSVLSPLLNIGLLTPQEVVDATLEHARAHTIPLQSLEGFLRQIIGWREFMRAAYVLKGRRQRTANFFEHRRAIPVDFWRGTTDIAPLDITINRVLKHAWAHHIERLMVLGNFMLLAEFHPHAVYRWFMSLFIDAYDWVMVPNVYGMTLHADGGLITTKPYIGASSYLRKMGNYPDGDWVSLWDALFWRFIERHSDRIALNTRLQPLSHHLKRMGPEKRTAHRMRADKYLVW